MIRQDEIRSLLRTRHRYLQVLQEQLAMHGRAQVPPRIILEIEDTEAEIENLRTRLETLENNPDTLPQRIEQQHQRIAEGLDELRQQATATSQRQVQVVGRPPLGALEHFKNRFREREKIGELLAAPTTRLVSVIGHGGMGKTALAGKILRDMEQHRWPHTGDDIPLDGIVYLSTRTAGINLERLFLDCAKLLGGDVETRLNTVWKKSSAELSTDDKIAQLLDAFKEGKYVVLLDNVEDLLDDKGRLVDENLRLFFDQSLSRAHGVCLLITSRVAVAFRHEMMRYDHQIKLLEGLPVAEGIELLRELDPNGDYGLRDAPEEQLAQAVQLVHGVPRALEVIAGILANDPFASLDEIMTQFYEQEDVVQVLIEENYKRLDDRARRVIQALAVFRRPMPSIAVDYLLEPFVPGLDVPIIVQRLSYTNIVSVDRANKTIILHPIDQDFAYSQLQDETGDEPGYNRQALERRAADWYVQLRTPEEAWKTIDDLAPQLTEFEHRIRAGDYDEACRVLEPIHYEYLLWWGHANRLVELRKQLAGKLVDPSLQSANLNHLGVIYRTWGQVRQAIKFQEQALNISRQIGDKRLEYNQLAALGVDYQSLGEIEHSIKHQELALQIAREISDKKEEGCQLGVLGASYFKLGYIERGKEFLLQAITIARETNDRLREAFFLLGLGNIYSMLGEARKGVNYGEEGLIIVRELNNRWAESVHLGDLGDIYDSLGQVEQAIEYYEQAIDIAQEINAHLVQGRCLGKLGRILLATGDIVQARQLCEEACSLNIPASHRYGAELTLGVTLLHQAAPKAIDIFSDTIAHCQVLLDKTKRLYEVRFGLATALVGQTVCNLRWAKETERTAHLTPAYLEYQRALDICDAPGAVQDALLDLELIQAAGIEGLEPVFELLQAALVSREVN